MGDFPRPFSGGENKKQKREESVKQALNAVMQGVQEAGRFASTMRFGKPAKTRVFDFKEDDKLADAVRFASTMRFGKQEAKEAPSERTKEMGGPNMISTGMAGVDPMTGMPQANQLTPTAINPNALGSMQPQIPSIAGTPQAGSYNNVMPQPAQTGLAAPLNLGKPVAKKPNYTMPEKTKYAKPPRKLYKDVDGVVKDEDGKDAGYPIIRQSSSSTKGYVK